MHYFDRTHIGSLAINQVGNKTNSEPLVLSQKVVSLSNTLEENLKEYYLSSFKTEEYFQMYHDVELSLNEAFVYISRIFDDPETLHEQSVNLAKHLYEQSSHPKIKGGEFYTVYFRDCIVDGDTVDAVGLFKSENKDTFLRVLHEGGNFNLESEQGINIKKLDKRTSGLR